MKCHKCQQDFNAAVSNCGTGTTWSLYKCLHCSQLYAQPLMKSGLPREVHSDKTIIILPFEDTGSPIF
ncbi:hypothetical protein LCGC14_2078390 [marine sediment metagenome]|uniref:Uncharacterized protein n=1 Tax=marine sediment metagenome TaxID=412755 RepID=A0A0F9GUQ1_9ZZZZ